jgi:DNA-directed RNA polymerase subunit omega
MARITVEDCLQKVNNRFSLIHMASKRVRELRKGSDPTISSKNRDIVVALREIAAGNIIMAPEGQAELLPGDDIDLLPEELSDQAELVGEAEEEMEEEQDTEDTEEK